MKITLKAARINKNFTQAEAAQKLSVSESTIGNWEKGKTFPGAKKINEIEKLYDIHYDDIIFLKENYA